MGQTEAHLTLEVNCFFRKCWVQGFKSQKYSSELKIADSLCVDIVLYFN